MASKVSVATRYKNVVAEMDGGSTMNAALKKHRLAASVFYRQKKKQSACATTRVSAARTSGTPLTQSAAVPHVLRTENADNQRIIVRLRKEIVVYRKALGLED